MTQTHDDQDVYDRETEFRKEELHLEAVVGNIDERIQQGEHMLKRPVHAGTPQAADLAKERVESDLQNDQEARDNPYFGRIDYSEGPDGEVHTVYIGNVHLYNSNDPYYSIASPYSGIAALYYNPASGSYNSPSGNIDATVQLKRMLRIDEAQLLDIDDVFKSSSDSTGDKPPYSRLLGQKLSGPSTGQIADIVQTIQPEQYEQIAATTKPVLIVQGAAGSGKSEIALFRIDFILSPHSFLGNLSRPTEEERVIMFGPSPAFLSYISNLLPNREIRKVRQTTVGQWLRSKFSSRVTLSSRDRTYDDLMNNRRKLTDAEIDAHAFKSGLKMKRLIDNYVNRLMRDVRERLNQSGGIRYAGSPPTEISVASLKRWGADAFRIHPQPNVARTYLLDRLAEEWMRGHPRWGRTQATALAEARRLVERGLTFWPRIDFRAEYMSLIQSPDKIMEYASKGDVDLAEATEISKTAPSGAGWALGMTDLAAALYLDYAINGFESERFEHIFVDEAQDVSPLEIVLMQMHSVNNTFTILGDLRQSILPYKSISNWNQLANLFERESVSRIESRKTYRSTRQITQYANRILQGLPRPSRIRMPEPHRGSGEKPKLVPSKSAAGMRIAIADSVRRVKSKENIRSVAVLTKWRQTAKDIGETLRDEGIVDVGVLTANGQILTDVTVSPIVLTKGLEFDAVLVANARKDNFYESNFDRMLLYLACTRARHLLEIHWYGTRSPIVPNAKWLNN